MGSSHFCHEQKKMASISESLRSYRGDMTWSPAVRDRFDTAIATLEYGKAMVDLIDKFLENDISEDVLHKRWSRLCSTYLIRGGVNEN